MVALGRPVGEPIAVVRANRVVATSSAARVAGISDGLRRREAQRRCPDVVIVEHDLDAEARAFDRVVRVLDDIAPRIEISRPGVCAIPTRGPSRYFGGDQALAQRVSDLVGAQLPDPSGAGVGIADGPFPATLAALRSLVRPGSPPAVIAIGESPTFVAPLSVGVLSSPGPCPLELTDVFGRLGLHRLSDVAALGAADLLARFGHDGTRAHRLASGLDERPPLLADPPADLAVAIDLDPPAERVDQAAFAGKALADRFIDALSARGLAASRVVVTARTTGEAVIERVWRDDGSLGAVAIAQRIRWQLDGWLSRPHAVQCGGVCRIELRPDDVRPATGRQEGFWGGADGRDERARRVAARLQAMVGGESVRMPEPRGGRSPSEQVQLVPIDAIAPGAIAPGELRDGVAWLGAVPAPLPAVVFDPARRASVVDHAGNDVAVTGRGVLSAAPAQLSIEGRPWSHIVSWAGPWLYDERWWDATAHRRRARFQMVTERCDAHLVALEAGQWWIEATYD